VEDVRPPADFGSGGAENSAQPEAATENWPVNDWRAFFQFTFSIHADAVVTMTHFLRFGDQALNHPPMATT
jgi:hypothetical protein